jgi:hypothetical protein
LDNNYDYQVSEDNNSLYKKFDDGLLNEYLANKDFSLFEKFTNYNNDELLNEYLKTLRAYENGIKSFQKREAAKLRFREINVNYYEQLARALLGLIPFESLHQYIKSLKDIFPEEKYK